MEHIEDESSAILSDVRKLNLIIFDIDLVYQKINKCNKFINWTCCCCIDTDIHFIANYNDSFENNISKHCVWNIHKHQIKLICKFNKLNEF